MSDDDYRRRLVTEQRQGASMSLSEPNVRSKRRARHGAPTISDVAKRAGVSSMTVSRVINGESNVRDTTREAVMAAIAALNYAPNPAARSLAGSAPTRIGMLYSNPSAGFLGEVLLGSLEQASRADVQIIVERCEPGHDELEVARHLIAGGIDGMLLPPPLCESGAMLELLKRSGVPAVAVATACSGAPLAVGIDDREAALRMTQHLMSLGHRRIGFIAGDPALAASGRRLDGHCAALAQAGIALDDSLVVDGRFTYRSGLDAAERLLDLPEPPTAIFASNDDMAAATIAVAHRRGIDVPADLTVCGFDDTPLATVIWPELTTIRQPIADMARVGIEMLVSVLRPQKPAAASLHRLLDFELIRRQSDAAPRVRPKKL